MKEVGHGRKSIGTLPVGHGPIPGVERRGDSIDLRPSDSVEQIARQMISTSFRQAWHKYHAEHGGAHDLPGRIVQAQNLLLTAFRRD